MNIEALSSSPTPQHDRLSMAALTTHLFLFFLSLRLLFLPISTLSTPMADDALIGFLTRLQSTALRSFGPSAFDPKVFVDMPLRCQISLVQQAFQGLSKDEHGVVPAGELKAFLERYLGEAGSDLLPAVPPDFGDCVPGFLGKVESGKVREWAMEVHGFWRNLSRRVGEDVRVESELHTLLPLPGDVVVPGSRFREVYYWDSYWVIRGLLVSKMHDTAKSIVNNLLFQLDEYGHVLNGARTYYINRSQPPLLSSMIAEIYKATGDKALVRRAFHSLLREHHFWNSGFHKITIEDAKGRKHVMSRYYAMWDQPRPESGTIDVESAAKLLTGVDKKNFYRELASTAESGWDFSSRWMSNHSDLTTLCTTSILPVDLNAFILKMELDLAYFAHILGEEKEMHTFLSSSKSRHEGMNSIFWNEKMGQWLDYWITTDTSEEAVHKWENHNQNQNIYASNFIPLWTELFYSDESTVEKVTKSLKNSGLLRPAGIATSTVKSGQQWDFPNGWAPIQHMIVEGLVKSKSKDAKRLAEDIAVKWIRTNYDSYLKTGAMHEKYDVEACGAYGSGGEYTPQTGFGWSNGVVLAFLEEFGWPQERKIKCANSSL